MDEATLCDRIALMQSGKILSIDTPAKIIDSYPVKLYAIKTENIYALLKDLHSYEKVATCFAFGEFVHITFNDQEKQNERLLLDYLTGKNQRCIELKEIKPTIEDCFIKLLK
jgi:ABC-2 type transport system ATP-binding protein